MKENKTKEFINTLKELINTCYPIGVIIYFRIHFNPNTIQQTQWKYCFGDVNGAYWKRIK